MPAGKSSNTANRASSIFEAESITIAEGLSLAAISSVTLESDSLLSVQAIHGNNSILLEVGHVINRCCNLLSCRLDVKIFFYQTASK